MEDWQKNSVNLNLSYHVSSINTHTDGYPRQLTMIVGALACDVHSFGSHPVRMRSGGVGQPKMSAIGDHLPRGRWAGQSPLRLGAERPNQKTEAAESQDEHGDEFEGGDLVHLEIDRGDHADDEGRGGAGGKQPALLRRSWKIRPMPRTKGTRITLNWPLPQARWGRVDACHPVSSSLWLSHWKNEQKEVPMIGRLIVILFSLVAWSGFASSEDGQGPSARLGDGTAVRVDVRLVKIGTDDLDELGVRWDMVDEASRLYLGLSADPLADDGSTGSRAMAPSPGDIDRLIAEAEDNGRAQVVSLPLTFNLGEEGNGFFAGREAPVHDAQGKVAKVEQYGLHMDFSLTSSEADRVDIGFRPSVDWLGADGRIESNDEIMPAALTTDVNVRLASGQTAILVGASKPQKDDEIKRVYPAIKDLPLMGDLFGLDEPQDDRTLVAVLLAPSF